MILDQLLEKKDVLIYIDLRRQHLLGIDIDKFPEEQREYARRKIIGRIKELDEIERVIRCNRLKVMSKNYWRDINT